MKKIILIKLGGSVVTHKDRNRSVRTEVLERLVAEIARALHDSDALIIIGHGQGSFAHAPAAHYRTAEGFVTPESLYGMAVTHDSAAQLNRIVVAEFLKRGLPAVSCPFGSMAVTENKKLLTASFAVLDEYLSKGVLPITGGDVFVDTAQGCAILSTEEVLSGIAEHYLQSAEYTVQKIIHVTDVAGVLNEAGEVVRVLNRQNWPEVQKLIGKTKGVDVTGGMGHKIEESLAMAERGVSVQILSGLEPESLYESIIGSAQHGTSVEG